MTKAQVSGEGYVGLIEPICATIEPQDQFVRYVFEGTSKGNPCPQLHNGKYVFLRS